jgi:hypothetical protein
VIMCAERGGGGKAKWRVSLFRRMCTLPGRDYAIFQWTMDEWNKT